jgi:hypothetical protein
MAKAIIRFSYVDETTGEEQEVVSATLQARDEEARDHVVGALLGFLAAGAQTVTSNAPELMGMTEEVVH